MSHFITLSHEDGPVQVNMDLVLKFWPRPNGTALDFGLPHAEPLHVKESPRLILLAMMQNAKL